MTACPPEDVFVLLLEHGLEAREQGELEAHLDRCRPCSDLVAQLRPPTLDAIPRGTEPHREAVGAGDRLGRYIITERIGQGGLGVVYAAHDTQLDRPVAIKTLHEGMAHTDERLALLRREARLLARCMHPAIVPIYDIGSTDEVSYIVMELVRGQTLQAWIETTAPTVTQIVNAYCEAATGIAVAHAIPVIHRDIKPSNIMRTEQGQVRVLDFGCAAELQAHISASERDATSGLSSTQIHSMWAGTPAYMAPEQWHGHADPLCDQFSFCAALYEGLFGLRPFSGKAIPTGTPRHPRPPQVSARLEAVLLRGLAIDPASRWPSIGHAHDALLQALPSARPRRRWPWILAGACVALPWFTPPSRCEDEPTAWRSTWEQSTRPRLREAFDASEAPAHHELFEHTAGRVDTYLDQWGAAYVHACRHPPRRDALTCLGQQRANVQTRVAALVHDGIDGSASAHSIFDDLADPSRCDGEFEVKRLSTQISSDVALRLAQLTARARTGDRRGLSDDALALERDTDTANAATRASVQAFIGQVELEVGRSQAAAQRYEQAYFLAGQARLPTLRARAAALRVLALATTRQFDAARQWVDHASAAVAGLPDPSHERALLELAVGLLAFEEGDLDTPLSHFAAAEAMWTHGPDPRPRWVDKLQLQTVRFHLTRGDHDQGLDLITTIIARTRETHGDHSPLLVPQLALLASIHLAARRPHDAATVLEEARVLSLPTAQEHELAHSGLELMLCVAKMRTSPRQLDQARGHCQRALELREHALGPDATATSWTRINLAETQRLSKDFDAAITSLERARIAFTAQLGDEHNDVLTTLLKLGQAHGEAGHVDEALALLQAVKRSSCAQQHTTSSNRCGLATRLVERYLPQD
ncbi:MAG: serine/threonine-protein kinase [Deltaproteobacteria bacterium]|nr:serine/threonine-protein kinase [Deltaproteobacteria bacterium]